MPRNSATMPDPRPILVFGPWSLRYDLGPSHPLTPRRFGPGIDLLGAVGGEDLRQLAPEPASDADLRTVHDAAYVRTVRRLSESPFGAAAGIGTGDTPAFAGMHAAAAAVAGGSLAAMEAILAGTAVHAFHPGGGLHHAMPDRASGFCVYNDPAIAIARARRAGLRVLYVDLDVHHGDGVEAVFAADPGVLTLSIHQSGRTLFPGTGFVDDLGEGSAAGTVVNLPVEPATGERGWLAALERVLPDLAASFGPDVVVSQHGADTHAWDPLANLRLTTTAMGTAARLVDAIAHRWAGGRWLATGGGGYDIHRVVPRSWSLVWLAMLHRDHGIPIPAAWRERWAAEAAGAGQAPLPLALEDAPNAGLPLDAAGELADARAVETADLVRAITVPSLLRAAEDRGWWLAIDELAASAAPSLRGAPSPGTGDAARTPGATGSPHDAPPIAVPTLPPAEAPAILDSVDGVGWAGLIVAPRVAGPVDPSSLAGLIARGLAHGEAAVSAAVVGDLVVGLAVSAPSNDGRRELVGLAIAPGHRGAGLGTELLRRHLAATPSPGGWRALVTVAERDAVAPLPVATRAGIARRLLAGAGFAVERPTGPLGRADRTALQGRRG